LHRLKERRIGSEGVKLEKSGISYMAYIDTSVQDSIVLFVEARDAKSPSNLFKLSQVFLKDK